MHKLSTLQLVAIDVTGGGQSGRPILISHSGELLKLVATAGASSWWITPDEAEDEPGNRVTAWDCLSDSSRDVKDMDIWSAREGKRQEHSQDNDLIDSAPEAPNEPSSEQVRDIERVAFGYCDFSISG